MTHEKLIIIHEKDQQYRVLSVAVVAVNNFIERVNVTLRITVSGYVTVFPPQLPFHGFHVPLCTSQFVCQHVNLSNKWLFFVQCGSHCPFRILLNTALHLQYNNWHKKPD